MQAITTKFLGATNTKPARIKATSGSGGYQYFDTKSEAVGHALTYGGFGIYAPIYNEVTA